MLKSKRRARGRSRSRREEANRDVREAAVQMASGGFPWSRPRFSKSNSRHLGRFQRLVQRGARS